MAQIVVQLVGYSIDLGNALQNAWYVVEAIFRWECGGEHEVDEWMDWWSEV